MFSRIWKPDETLALAFEITSPTKKISRNYHCNKFSKFNFINKDDESHLKPRDGGFNIGIDNHLQERHFMMFNNNKLLKISLLIY